MEQSGPMANSLPCLLRRRETRILTPNADDTPSPPVHSVLGCFSVAARWIGVQSRQAGPSSLDAEAQVHGEWRPNLQAKQHFHVYDVPVLDSRRRARKNCAAHARGSQGRI